VFHCLADFEALAEAVCQLQTESSTTPASLKGLEVELANPQAIVMDHALFSLADLNSSAMFDSPRGMLRKCTFGKTMLVQHFSMNQTVLQFNSASYGQTPTIVNNARAQWEALSHANPSCWQAARLYSQLQRVRARVADFFVADHDGLVLTQNANTATSIVLKNIKWEPGDSILLFSVDYHATELCTEELHETLGLETFKVVLELPMSDAEILKEVREALRRRQKEGLRLPKLANFCHVTSRTAYIFPAAELTTLFHEYGILVSIDGAQAAGHLDLNLRAIGADFYIGTMHKWMYTCQGVGFLYVAAAHRRATIKPLSAPVFAEADGKLIDELLFTGAFDFSPFLSIMQAFDFVEHVCGGWPNVRKYIDKLAEEVVAILRYRWGTEVVQRTNSGSRYGHMPIMPFPQGIGSHITNLDASKVMAYLMKKNMTVFVMVEPFIVEGRMQNHLCVRLAVNIFHNLEQFEALAEAINSLDGRYTGLKMAQEVLDFSGTA
jgi:isopenicillin-N epimerase